MATMTTRPKQRATCMCGRPMALLWNSPSVPMQPKKQIMPRPSASAAAELSSFLVLASMGASRPSRPGLPGSKEDVLSEGESGAAVGSFD